MRIVRSNLFGKIIILIKIFLISTTLLRAQQSQLLLKEQASHLALSNAQIAWQSMDNALSGNTQTNAQGVAQIPLPIGSKLRLTVSSYGHKSMTDTVLLAAVTELYLEADLFNLEQVSVTGTRTPHLLKQTPVMTQVITAEEISKQGAATIKDVLEKELPGMEIGQHGNSASMSMQGLDPQYTLVLIDGERMAGETGGNVDFSRIGVANIQQIEIVRGTSSALYGSNAMGGVINIITKRPKQPFDLSVQTRYAQQNQQNYSESFIAQQDEGYVKTFYRRQDMPNANADVWLGCKRQGFFTNLAAGVKSSDAYELFNTQKQIRRYLYNDSTVQLPIATTPTQINGNFQYSISNTSGFDLGKRIKTELRASYYDNEEADMQKDNKHNRFRSYTLGGFTDFLIDSLSKIRVSHTFDQYNKYYVFEKLNDDTRLNYKNVFNNSKIIYHTTLKQQHRLLAGAELFQDVLTTDMFTQNQMLQKGTTDGVLMLQDEYSIDTNLCLVAGLRVGYHSTFKSHASPSVTLRYGRHRFIHRISYSRGYRSPGLKELFMQWDHLGMFTIFGNQNLKPETNDYLSLSTDYYNLNKKLNVTAMASYNKIYDKIDGLWTNNETEYRYVNLDNQQILTGELLLRWKFLQHWGIKGGYSYTKIVMDGGAVNRSIASPHGASAQLEFSRHWQHYAFGANLSAKVVGPKQLYVLDELLLKYYQTSYASYWLCDLAIQQTFRSKFMLELGAKNLFNYTAPIVTFNTTVSPGRRCYLLVSYNF